MHISGLMKPIIFFFIIISVGVVHAQKNSEVSNVPFKAKGDSINGVASYEFNVIKKDTIFDGRFTYIKVSDDFSFDKDLQAVSLEGFFKKGKKNKLWTYSDKRLSPADTFIIDEYSLKFPANGEEVQVLGFFDESQAVDNWQVFRHILVNGVSRDTIHTVNATFNAGLIIGDFRADNNGAVISGGFNKQGVLDGEWVVARDNWMDKRIYENGFLVEHTLRLDDDLYTISHMVLNQLDTNVEQSTLHFVEYNREILSFSQKIDNKLPDDVQKIIEEKTQSASVFSEQSLKALTHNGEMDIWNALPGSQTVYTGFIRVNDYPLTDSELEKINSIHKHNNEISRRLKQFFAQPQIELGKYGSEDFAFYHAVLMTYQNIKPQLDVIDEALQSEALIHFNRDSILTDLMPAITLQQEIVFEFNDDTLKRVFDFPKYKKTDLSSVNSISNLFDGVYSDVDDLINKSDALIKRLEKQTALSKFEKRLIKKRDTAVSLFENKLGDKTYNDFHQKFSDDVGQFLENRLKEYARLELEKKEDSIDYFLACFDNVLHLYDELADVPRKLNRLDDLYTSTTFNLHTMTDMDERVKERLYIAFERDIFPEILVQLQENLDCQTIEKNIERISFVYTRMVEIREEDTRDKERALRRASDFESKWNIILVD